MQARARAARAQAGLLQAPGDSYGLPLLGVAAGRKAGPVATAHALFPQFGQSLSTGANDQTKLPPINDAAAVAGYGNRIFRPNGGYRIHGDFLDPSGTMVAVDVTNSATMVTPGGETHSNSTSFTETGCARFCMDVVDAGLWLSATSFTAGHGAQAWTNRPTVSTDKDNLRPGTLAWCNLCVTMRRMWEHMLAAHPGAPLEIPYLLWNQGEAEIVQATGETFAQTVERITENIRQVVNAFRVYVRLLTGNPDALPSVLVWLKPLSSGADADKQAVSRKVAHALTVAVAAVEGAIAVTPEYVSGNYDDETHKEPLGYEANGANAAIAVIRDQFGEPTVPLFPDAVSQDSTTVTLRMNARAGGLVQDVATVPAVTNDGYQVWDATSTVQRAVSGVTYAGPDVRIEGTGFQPTDVVRVALEDRAAGQPPVGANTREADTRPRWVAPFEIALDEFAPIVVEPDPVHVSQYVAADYSSVPFPRNVTVYSHAWNTLEEQISQSEWLAGWISARPDLESGGIIHDMSKRQRDASAMQGTLSRVEIDGVWYFTDFSATNFVEGPAVISADGHIGFALAMTASHSSSANRVIGVKWQGTNNFEYAIDIVARKLRVHCDAGLNSFSGFSAQWPDDGLPHVCICGGHVVGDNNDGDVQGKIDGAAWTSMGTMSNGGQRNVNVSWRLGNGNGAFPAVVCQVSDAWAITGNPYEPTHVELIADIEAYRGF